MLVARGVEELVRSNGRMRLLVGCTLEEKEVAAIKDGSELRLQVEKTLLAEPLEPINPPMQDALALLAWMVEHEYLDVKVVIPFDEDGKPLSHIDALYHEKSGLFQDSDGDRIAWNGSLNESEAGWRRNWEKITVYTDWKGTKAYIDDFETEFECMWQGSQFGNGVCWTAMDIPTALKDDLLRFLPKDGQLPKRIQEPSDAPVNPIGTEEKSSYWEHIRQAPKIPNGGELVGESTANVAPWPHQVRAFERLYKSWPPRLLIADEVGLGKTIQAGMLIRQAILAGKAKRILVLAPKAVLKQWQLELREKFNLNWPVYDGSKFVWRLPARLGKEYEEAVGSYSWHEQSAFLMSSQLARRQDRAATLLTAEPWDLIVLDEAHHARRRASGTLDSDRPNKLLQLMRELQSRTSGLLLLTATPMQVDPIEVWDLLNLLGIPEEWSSNRYSKFLNEEIETTHSFDKLIQNVDLFHSTERNYGEIDLDSAKQVTELSRFDTGLVLRAIRSAKSATIPLKKLGVKERGAALKLIRNWTPIRHGISRHTRELLRRYVQARVLTENVAHREVSDEFVSMSTIEASIYAAVEEYIQFKFKQAPTSKRSAIGFVLTVYRRRMASSFYALKRTLENRYRALRSLSYDPFLLDDDVTDDELIDEIQTAEDVEKLQIETLEFEEHQAIAHLLKRVHDTPDDSKFERLIRVLKKLRDEGYEQVMVFTQYTDTMDFLRNGLMKLGMTSLLCYSGRGGEVSVRDELWDRINRDIAKSKFKEGSVETFICTDAASEGLNFQFCGAIVNYDMPWNPMRVEQRIGRIDRVGQRFKTIKIINLHYEDTVEADVYRALRERIGLFEQVIGPLQPILARLPSQIGDAVLNGEKDRVREVAQEIEEGNSHGFDIDTLTYEYDTRPIDRPTPTLDFHYLERALVHSYLLPSSVKVRSLGYREFGVTVPGDSETRVTTKPTYYDEHPDSVELWSPGGSTFDKVQQLSEQEFSSD